MKIKTWHVETLVVAMVLVGVNIVIKAPTLEYIGTFAVITNHCLNSITQRYLEKDTSQQKPQIECSFWMNYYFWTKEVLWAAYFILNKNYAPLIGCLVFALYPVWRKFWRTKYPL